MSANLTVDLGNTSFLFPSIATKTIFPASGNDIGNIVDMIEADTFTNLVLTGRPAVNSGQLRVFIQTSDTTVSGDFTDPTSGMASGNWPFPTVFESGGIIRLNSGGLGEGFFGAGTSGQYIRSGFMVAGAFQRPHRYVRANVLSGDFYFGTLQATLVAQRHVTGSGGGFWGSSGFYTVTI